MRKKFFLFCIIFLFLIFSVRAYEKSSNSIFSVFKKYLFDLFVRMPIEKYLKKYLIVSDEYLLKKIKFHYGFFFEEEDFLVETVNNCLKITAERGGKKIVFLLDKKEIEFQQLGEKLSFFLFNKNIKIRESLPQYSLLVELTVIINPNSQEIEFLIPYVLSSDEYELKTKDEPSINIKFIKKNK